VTDPAWPEVQAWIREAKNSVELLPPEVERRNALREKVGTSPDSLLGAVIHETGGILIDQGWLRILGSGSAKLPRVAHADRGWILIADDVVGGFFALHPPEGDVKYFPPDTLKWEALEMKYSAWFRWCLSEKLGGFYKKYRAPGWEGRICSLQPDQGFHIWPPPWSEGPPYYERSWEAVPMNELYHIAFEVRDQIGGFPSLEE
jgi:hypothetical protein